MHKLIKIHLPLLYILFVAGMFTLGCTKDKTNYAEYHSLQPIDTVHTPTDTSNTSTKTFTFLALGDSYTIGQSVQPVERFPAQSASFLIKDSIKFSPIQYIATTGWTTTNLQSAIALQKPPHNYDIVTLLIGVNDQYQHMDTGMYRIKFSQLLDSAIAYSDNRISRVFVLSIPDYSVTPFVYPADKARVSMEIDWFNAINKQITSQRNIAYINITPSTRQGATDPTLIANDGLHPSAKEYSKWASMLAPLLKSVLR